MPRLSLPGISHLTRLPLGHVIHSATSDHREAGLSLLVVYRLETHGSRSPKQAQLAVVGISCRLSGGANDTELFWELLVEGRDVHTRVPAHRFDLDTHFDPTGQTPSATQTPFGNFI
jgi:asperthecin polyketide synthase